MIYRTREFNAKWPDHGISLAYEGELCKTGDLTLSSALFRYDALGNLVLAAIAVLSGFRTCTFGFDEEPGEFRWIVEAIDPNTVRVEVREFEELWGEKPNSDGKLLFEYNCPSLEFAKAIQSTALAVLEEYGVAGYNKQWAEYPFPERQLNILGELVATRE